VEVAARTSLSTLQSAVGDRGYAFAALLEAVKALY
jgi:hypothetical protein